MGVFDTYGERHVQMKVGHCALQHYHVGDPVAIADGVYIGYEGVIVVLDGRLAACFDSVKSKWGDVINPDAIIGPHNPIDGAIVEVIRKLNTA